MTLPSGSTLLDPTALLTRSGVRALNTVADLGCGTTGHFVFPAARMVGPSGKVYAVDIQKSVLAGIASRAKIENATNLETLWGDCEVGNGVRIPPGTIDITLVINNLYQSKNRTGYLREAIRITKVGGKVVVVDWKTTSSPLGPTPQVRVASETVKNEAMDLGLHLLEAYEPGPYHWGLIFTK